MTGRSHIEYQADSTTDRYIAALVLGDKSVCDAYCAVAPYSSEIGAAMCVIDALIAAGYEVALVTTSGTARTRGRWTCVLVSPELGTKALANTLPLAICRAALALVDAVR